jgi:hypothetical protein
MVELRVRSSAERRTRDSSVVTSHHSAVGSREKSRSEFLTNVLFVKGQVTMK